ncbi:potassium-transporting ATPase subunit C [Actinokineospora globicatena]|uniref:Potassium-transporting ATPase KdpC subunit n=1 Tax=Actinokineospora globicatena TaxID=103729 RepID=A0A9W6QK27_9PSEU|nr:potassium-transporting ATPase subunit C [Actinokineospora globicatena]GLW89949.1 potassium-transporting ATPase KdpC subunit [Actinokineospora globicatena]
MKNLGVQSMAGLRALLILTVLTGVLYPSAVWAVSRLPGLHANAEAVDTTLVGVQPDGLFYPRPSAATLPASGGSNKSEVNTDYDAVIADRRQEVAQRENVPASEVPLDAITASASGLDPHISPEYAALQVPRVARETGLSPAVVEALVADATSGRDLGFVGQPRVNVTELNRALTTPR